MTDASPTVGEEPWRFHEGHVKGPADGSSDLFDFITVDGRQHDAQKQPNFWHLVALWRPHVRPTPKRVAGMEGAFVTVPREATEGMWEAYHSAQDDRMTAGEIWSAMLSAAPSVPDTLEREAGWQSDLS